MATWSSKNFRTKLIVLTGFAAFGGRSKSGTAYKGIYVRSGPPYLSNPQLRLTRIFNDLVHDPERRSVFHILVAIDLLLLVTPIRQRRIDVTPHGNLSVDMNELEERAFAHPLLSCVRVFDLNREVRVRLP